MKQDIFNPKRNLNKDDKITKKFINRLENARIEETKKKERFENLGKVKVNNLTNNNNNHHHIPLKTSQVEIGHGHMENGVNLDDLVKNLRKELRDINLESNSQINI